MDSNVYYHPEQSGLEQVGVLDEGGLSYEYNTLVVLRDSKTGRLFYAQDSGCSCPTPFEQFHFNSADDTDLTEIKADTYEQFRKDVDNFPDDHQSRADLVQKVRLLLKAA